jgi:hypothetical protein
MSPKRQRLYRRLRHDLFFSSEKELPQRRWVQRTAGLCTHWVMRNASPIRIEDCGRSDSMPSHFRKCQPLRPISMAEHELPVPI